MSSFAPGKHFYLKEKQNNESKTMSKHPSGDELFTYADDLGPAKIIAVYESRLGLKGILVIDNVAIGPSIGGLRMAADVSTGECFRLARAMTLKNAAAGLPHGGGKSVIFADPKMPWPGKERLIRAFASALGDIEDYIFGPDMGTDEICMACIKDEIGRAVGLPAAIGGIPLDEIGATGFGLSVAVEAAASYCNLAIDGAKVAVQGFGSVGKHVARFLRDKGAVLIAASDSSATLHDAKGLDVSKLISFKNDGLSLSDYPAGEHLDRDAVIGIECDIWIPAARPDILRADNVERLHARLVAQGANIPATPQAERIMHEKGILVLPDFIANAGGVICGAVEYAGGNRASAFAAIEEKIGANTHAVLQQAIAQHIPPRQAALAIAGKRVETAMTYRRAF